MYLLMLFGVGSFYLQKHILKRRDKVSVNKENKKQLVSELASQLKDAKSIVFVDVSSAISFESNLPSFD